jgi:hypothetical protein
MFDQAIAELKTGMHLSEDSPYALDKLGHGYGVAQMRQEAQRVLNQLQTLSEQKYVSPFDVAMVHVGLEEKDEAFRWLDTAYERRSLWLGYLGVEPQLDPLRSDTRFQKLLGRMGLSSQNPFQ